MNLINIAMRLGVCFDNCGFIELYGHMDSLRLQYDMIM